MFVWCFCCRYHQPHSEIERYIDKMQVLEDRFDLYVEVPMYRKAAETALKLKDIERLESVSAVCGSDP
jgi:hypothetical protein